ncbi:MAG: hypothetical protein ABIR84_03340 [Candidatus Nitrotoga sp.]
MKKSQALVATITNAISTDFSSPKSMAVQTDLQEMAVNNRQINAPNAVNFMSVQMSV